MKVYDWGFFFEDGNRASMPVPFGPEHPDNVLFDLSDEWFERFAELFPNFKTEMYKMDLPFACVVVNPPREATEEEVDYFKDKV